MADIIALKRKDNWKVDMFIFDDIVNGRINAYFVNAHNGFFLDIDEIIKDYIFPEKARLIAYLEEFQKNRIETEDF